MKLGLEEQMNRIIAGYKANYTAEQEAFKAVYDPFKTPSYAERFTDDGLREEIKEQLEDINSSWKKYDLTVNQNVKEAVSSAKDAVLQELDIDGKETADYAVRIANARAFLKDELDSVDFDGVPSAEQARELDESMYLILKDFVSDYETMKLFRKMVERKTPVLNSMEGGTLFPKTFGKTVKAESVMNTLDQMEEIAENLFIHKRNGGQEYFRYHKMAFYIPEDGYAETADEQAIVDLAVIADDAADNLDTEGAA